MFTYFYVVVPIPITPCTVGHVICSCYCNLIATFQIFPLLSRLLKSYANADATLLQLGDIVAIAADRFLFFLDGGFLQKPNAIAASWLLTWSVILFCWCTCCTAAHAATTAVTASGATNWLLILNNQFLVAVLIIAHCMLMVPLLLSPLVNHQFLFYLLICRSCLPWCHHHRLIVILFFCSSSSHCSLRCCPLGCCCCSCFFWWQ